MKNLPYFVAIIIGTVFDQISKYTAQETLPLGSLKAVIPNWLYFTLVYNKGVAFSLFSDGHSLVNYLVFILALLICVYLTIAIIKDRFNRLQKSAGALIIAGAIGNVLDRLFNGYVIDFIYFNHHSFSWPVFNLADSFISVGAFLLIIESFAQNRRSALH